VKIPKHFVWHHVFIYYCF